MTKTMTYMDRNLLTKEHKGTSYEILYSWAKNHFPCFQKQNFDLIEHISKVCLSRYGTTFIYEKNDDLNEVSLSVLEWLKIQGNRIDLK